MRYIITSVAVLLGVTLLIICFVAGRQFREIARSPTVSTLNDSPLLDFIGGDLLRDPSVDAQPAEVAQQVQQRIGLIALAGLTFLLAGTAFFSLTMSNKKRYELDPSSS